jgi:hypothetical protein
LMKIEPAHERAVHEDESAVNCPFVRQGTCSSHAQAFASRAALHPQAKR